MRTKLKLLKSATMSISNNGPAVPSLSFTRDTVPTTMSGGARLSEPPAVTIGDPGCTTPKRWAASTKRTVGTRPAPRPSKIPVSRTETLLPGGIVNEEEIMGVRGAAIDPGVKPAMFDVAGTVGTVICGSIVSGTETIVTADAGS